MVFQFLPTLPRPEGHVSTRLVWWLLINGGRDVIPHGFGRDEDAFENAFKELPHNLYALHLLNAKDRLLQEVLLNARRAYADKAGRAWDADAEKARAWCDAGNVYEGVLDNREWLQEDHDRVLGGRVGSSQFCYVLTTTGGGGARLQQAMVAEYMLPKSIVATRLGRPTRVIKGEGYDAAVVAALARRLERDDVQHWWLKTGLVQERRDATADMQVVIECEETKDWERLREELYHGAHLESHPSASTA